MEGQKLSAGFGVVEESQPHPKRDDHCAAVAAFSSLVATATSASRRPISLVVFVGPV